MTNIKVVPASAPTSPAPENVVVQQSPSGPKPCCVCKDEKAARDECFLFSDKGGEVECVDKIDAYKKCMAGFGFKI
ncbi:cytochrome C oxidase copper chaperone-domain-containing protein [Tricharina praecox]|uniref:cytochrome C oxidase copper chaperone-domain-containing protein n=1 Tax=Tricharina praecox TaxID=43433 RepID=UPI002220F801|nr:cytochrome C oxidase copper chaperone-domain-containing protein [Tricharina praecox]KAI5857588.1 cytochrome C oxidase copper chaperone-domain-containing protein [Tricharina praecox]